MTKYPLCDRAGFKIWLDKNLDQVIYVRDVEKFLEGATVVYGRPNVDPKDGFMYGWSDCRVLDGNEEYYPDTHTARLVMIEPIQKDTAEGLLREFVSWSAGDGQCNSKPGFPNLVARAKKLLESK